MAGKAWASYLEALKHPFVKLARLEFLNPDGSVSFAYWGRFFNDFHSINNPRKAPIKTNHIPP